jgi:hypothetical protein
MKRTMARKWHQARLGVIPTNDFLHKIKCADTEKCVFDGQVETNKHFVIECKEYRSIWNRHFPERNKRNTEVNNLLNGKSTEDKRHICEALVESWNKRSKRIVEETTRKGKDTEIARNHPKRKRYKYNCTTKLKNRIIPNKRIRRPEAYTAKLDEDKPPHKLE